MNKMGSEFDELTFFAQVKKSPALYFGKPSLLSLRDCLGGMTLAFSFCHEEEQFRYFNSFVKWYHEEIIKDLNGYACWWNHILYKSGNCDDLAFVNFFRAFERYLREVHGVSLPDLA